MMLVPLGSRRRNLSSLGLENRHGFVETSKYKDSYEQKQVAGVQRCITLKKRRTKPSFRWYWCRRNVVGASYRSKGARKKIDLRKHQSIGIHVKETVTIMQNWTPSYSTHMAPFSMVLIQLIQFVGWCWLQILSCFSAIAAWADNWGNSQHDRANIIKLRQVNWLNGYKWIRLVQAIQCIRLLGISGILLVVTPTNEETINGPGEVASTAPRWGDQRSGPEAMTRAEWRECGYIGWMEWESGGRGHVDSLGPVSLNWPSTCKRLPAEL